MKIFLVTAFLLFSAYGQAQKYRAPFGEMPDSEILEALRMTSYPADTAAKALILYSRDEADGAGFKRLLRIKIFDKSAYETGDLVKKDSYLPLGAVYELKGFSYNLVDGKIEKTALDETNIFKTRYSKYYNKLTFTMPRVTEGTVIEYYFSREKYNVGLWNLQFPIPSLFSEVLYSPAYKFRASLRGPLPIQYALQRGQIHQWFLADAPAFVREEYMPHEDLYRSSIQIWPHRESWEKELEALWDFPRFGGIIFQQIFLADKTREIVRDIKDPKERIKAVLTYIKSTIEWNGIEDSYGTDPVILLQNKSGSSGDINLMLISMLAKSQITVNPILLSTRDNGNISETMPTLSQFNYVIAEAIVGKDTLYLDATQRDLPYDCLPIKCINVRAFNAAKEQYKWFTLKTSYKHKISAEGTFTLDETGSLAGKLAFSREGYAAPWAHQNYKRNTDDYRGDIKDTWAVDNKTYKEDTVNNFSFQEQYDVTISDHATAAGDKIYLNPYVFPFAETNPFQSDQRRFPVEFECSYEKILLCTITLPPGYQVDELPQSKVLAIPGNGARATFNISSTGTQVLVMARVQINRTFFSAEDYHLLKEFYARIFSKQGEQIVLKKVL